MTMNITSLFLDSPEPNPEAASLCVMSEGESLDHQPFRKLFNELLHEPNTQSGEMNNTSAGQHVPEDETEIDMESGGHTTERNIDSEQMLRSVEIAEQGYAYATAPATPERASDTPVHRTDTSSANRPERQVEPQSRMETESASHGIRVANAAIGSRVEGLEAQAERQVVEAPAHGRSVAPIQAVSAQSSEPSMELPRTEQPSRVERVEPAVQPERTMQPGAMVQPDTSARSVGTVQSDAPNRSVGAVQPDAPNRSAVTIDPSILRQIANTAQDQRSPGAHIEQQERPSQGERIIIPNSDGQRVAPSEPAPDMKASTGMGQSTLSVNPGEVRSFQSNGIVVPDVKAQTEAPPPTLGQTRAMAQASVELIPTAQASGERSDRNESHGQTAPTWMQIPTVRTPGSEAIFAVERAQAQLPPEQVMAPKMIDQIVRTARVQLIEGGASMTLRLDPPHLGTLNMSVSAQNNMVTASLQVSSEAARRILEADLPMLRQALAGAGINVDSIEVSVGGDRDQAWTSHADAHQGRPENRGHGSSQASRAFAENNTTSETPTPVRAGSSGRLDYLV